MAIQVSTAPKPLEDKTINQIELWLGYSYNRRECSYSVAAYQYTKSQEGGSWQSGVFGMTAYGTWESGWDRDNSRRVKKYETEARHQIVAKSGKAWDIVSQFAQKHGLEILHVTP